MSIWRYALWFLSAAMATGLFLYIGNRIAQAGKKYLRVLFFLLRIVLVPVFGLCASYLDAPFFWRFNMVFAALYVASLGTVAGDFLCLALKLAARIDLTKYGRVISFVNKEKNRLRIVAAVSLCVFLYGTLLSQLILPRTYTFSSKKLENTYDVVLITDLHYGGAQPEFIVRKLFERIGKEAPDMIFLCGDITDEYTTKEQMETIYRIIGETGIPTVAAPGNHDRQWCHSKALGRTYSDEELEQAMFENGIRLLEDEYLPVGNDLVLLGRTEQNAPGRTSMDGTENPVPEALFVVLDHIPFPEADLLKVGADLQLSGHSHGGQYFPLKLIYEAAGGNPAGEYHFGNAVLYTSVGASGWRWPFRTEGFCRYEQIRLEPEK